MQRFVKLDQIYSVLYVRNIEACVFLQGLITNDINKCKNRFDNIYTAMLDAKGKYMFDFFIIKLGDNEYCILCHKLQKQKLFQRLNIYKLSSQVEVIDNEEEIDYNIIYIFPDKVILEENTEINNNSQLGSQKIIDNLQNLMNVADAGNDIIIAEDSRGNNLGVFFIYPQKLALKNPHSQDQTLQNTTMLVNNYFAENNFKEVNQEQFLFYLYKWHLPVYDDFISEISIILEFRFNELNAINYDKGCYIGQELITRTHRRGQIRKTLYYIEFELENKQSLPEKNSIIVIGDNKVKIGKLLSYMKYPDIKYQVDSDKNIVKYAGHALLRIEELSSATENKQSLFIQEEQISYKISVVK